MKNYKYTTKLISLIFSGIVLTGCATKDSSKIVLSVDTTYNSSNATTEQTTIITDEYVDEHDGEKTKFSDTTTIPETITISSSTIPETSIETSNLETSNKDNIVIEEFNNLKDDISKLLNSETTNEIKNFCKESFITIVDFIFYDGDIKGITFDDISDAAKETIIKDASTIDKLIIKKFPNYKEEISSSTKSAYNKAAELIYLGADKFKNFSKDLLGEHNYNAIKEFKDNLKEVISDNWDELKEDVGDLYGSVKDKIKDWYINFKN